MTTSKQAKLSITLKSVELIKELSLGLAPIGCIATRNFCNEISRTLINQAGEIDALTAKIQSLATASNSYEVHWDSLIFAIMGTDSTADIIDAADAERVTAAAIATIKKLASDRDEKQRVAEAFQATNNSECTLFSRRYYHNGAHAGSITYPSMLNVSFSAEALEELDKEINQTREIGNFKNLFVNIPSGHAEITLEPCETFSQAIQATTRDHYRKLIESEIADYFAGLYQPGTPDIQDGAKLQSELMKRVDAVFTDKVKP